MNELQIFSNPDFGQIRAVEMDGEPWLVGKDVAVALGYQNPQRAIRNHVDSEDKGVSEMVTPGGKQMVPIINESGLYSLILSSKLPGARKFKHWVTSEVLPSIRKTGGYGNTHGIPPEVLAQLVANSQTFTDGMVALSSHMTTIADRTADLEKRMAALESNQSVVQPSVMSMPTEDAPVQVPGRAARRRWMRTLNEKLDLLEGRFNANRSALLHQLYLWIEERFDVVLDEERLKVMEQQGLDDCSVLMAVYYNEKFRDRMQKDIDGNLALEDRGW